MDSAKATHHSTLRNSARNISQFPFAKPCGVSCSMQSRYGENPDLAQSLQSLGAECTSGITRQNATHQNGDLTGRMSFQEQGQSSSCPAYPDCHPTHHSPQSRTSKPYPLIQIVG